MSKYYLAREQPVTVSATKTPLQKFGSTTATSDPQVPASAKSLEHILAWGASAGNVTSADSMFVRLEGAGLPNGPEAFALGALGEVTAASGAFPAVPAYYNGLKLPVKPSNPVQIFGEIVGGAPSVVMGVTVCFDEKGPGTQPAAGQTVVTRTYEGSSSTTQTDNTLSSQGSVSSPPLNVPPFISGSIARLKRLTHFAAGTGGTVGSEVFTLRVGGQGIQLGEQDFIAGGQGGQLATHVDILNAFGLQIGENAMSSDYGTEGMGITGIQNGALTVQVAGAETNTGTKRHVVTAEWISA